MGPNLVGSWVRLVRPCPNPRAAPAPVLLDARTQVAPLSLEAREARAGEGGAARHAVINALPAVETGLLRQAHGHCGTDRGQHPVLPSVPSAPQLPKLVQDF